MDCSKSAKDPMTELWDKIKSVRVAMLATVDADGLLRSRPMATQDREPEGTLWFFTGADTAKVGAIAADERVVLSYASADKDLYISVSGRAKVIEDAAKARQMWNFFAKPWFPGGPEDPDLRLIEVTVERAEYWHDRSPKVVQFVQMAAAALTGQRADALTQGADRKLEF